MGKNSVNRSKFQPSSSSQAFSQMQGNAFIGFSSGRIPGAALSELSGNLQMAFKKASKKDVTTKLKAFTQLHELFSTKEVDKNIESCLDLWCSLFRGLLLERERRIRETGLKAHGVLLQTAGRRVAPYLKRLIGPWILFLHDSSRSCRSIASDALFQSIPEHKHLATWSFCKGEIMSFIIDRIDQTPQALCPPSIAKGAEANEIYEENMSSSLLSLGFLLNTLTKEDTAKLHAKYESLVQNESLWKLGKHSGSLVPAAFLQFIDQVMVHIPEVLTGQYEKIFGIFVQALKSKERMVCQYLWKPLVRSIRDQAEQVDSVSPKLCRQLKEQIFAFFREGACGTGPVAYPSLAILVPHIPQSVRVLSPTPFQSTDINEVFIQISGKNLESFVEQLLSSLWKATELRNVDLQDMVICYVDVLLFSLNTIFLPNYSTQEEAAPSWIRSITKPFEEYLTATKTIPSGTHSELIRLFCMKGTEQQKLALFGYFMDITEKQFTQALQMSDSESNEILHRCAAFLKGAYRDWNTLMANYEMVIPNLFTKATENPEKESCLLFGAEITEEIPFSYCTKAFNVTDYFNDSLLPLLRSVVHTNNAQSNHTAHVLHLLGNYFTQEASCQSEMHSALWSSLLLIFKELEDINALNEFLKRQVYPESNHKMWRHEILDKIVEDASTSSRFSSCEEIRFKFLRFTMGGHTMTPEASLVSKTTRIKVLGQIIATCQSYQEEAVCEDKFNFQRIQGLLYGMKLICDSIATNLLPMDCEESRRAYLQAMRMFFGLSVDIKYFWKKMTIEFPSFVVSSSSSQDDVFDISSHGFTMKEIEQSPVALAARYAWNLIHPFLQERYEKTERISFIRSLIDSVHEEIHSCDITWFRPILYTQQIRMLISLVEHSSTQYILDQSIQSKEYWMESRSNLSNVDSLVDYFKADISFFELPSLPHENLSKSNTSYPRMLSFLLALMRELGVDVVVGKADFRRVWTIIEVYCGYCLCKDLIVPPIDKSTEWQEEWAMVIDLLIPLVNSQLNFPSALDSPFIKALMACAFSCISGDNQTLLDLYGTSYLFHKLIQGDHLRSEAFIRLYYPSLASDLLGATDHRCDLLRYQCCFPELLDNLKRTQCESLEFVKLYQSNINRIMNQDISVVGLESLIHLSSAEGILCDGDQALVATSLLVFFHEWEQLGLQILQDDLVRFQCIRFFIALCSHPKTSEQTREHTDFFISFIIKSLPSLSTLWENKKHQSLLFYALKLAKHISKEHYSENKALDDLYLWLLDVLTSSCAVTEYSPSLNNLFDTLTQAVLSLRSVQGHVMTADREISLFKLLRCGHIGLQKAAYHVLWLSMSKTVELNESNALELQEMLPLELYEMIHVDESLFLSSDWLSHETLEAEEIGYAYRTGLIELVSYSFAWLLLCQLYTHQPLDVRRAWSNKLRKEAPVLLSFFFDYVNLRSPVCTPDEINIRAFDPRYVESLDKFLCDLYFMILRVFPSLVRDWWCTDCSRSLTNTVEMFTTKYVSPVLIRHEIRVVQNYEHNFDNFEMKANYQMKQVQAFYEEDEVQLGISLSIPDSYPLRDIVVSSEKKFGVTESQWRQWMLSIHVLLHTQDANILDAVLLWKSRMDKLFEGIECCLICYSVFQASNNALPRLACKTCKNKFHSACLYKWFNTSHKSNCPLCQTPWME